MPQVILYIDSENEKVLLELKKEWTMSKTDVLQTIIKEFFKKYEEKKSQKEDKEEIKFLEEGEFDANTTN